SFFSFTDTSIYYIFTLSLHDALPILNFLVNASDELSNFLLFCLQFNAFGELLCAIKSFLRWIFESIRIKISFERFQFVRHFGKSDRKSTRLNSSHRTISYAVFCLKKK